MKVFSLRILDMISMVLSQPRYVIESAFNSKHQQTPLIINDVAEVFFATYCTIRSNNIYYRSIGFSVDFSSPGLMLPAGMRLIKMLYIFQRRTGCPLWAIFCSSVNFFSSLVGGDILR